MTSSQAQSTLSKPMQGKTVLITGATNGVGKATAADLIQQGAEVWIVGRDAQKTAAVAQEIGAAGHLLADLSLRPEALRMAREFTERVGKLDVLINNAGAIYDRRQESKEGIEMTWALNHLAYFIVTRELLPLLRASRGRIVNVSSSAHAGGKIRWQDPEFKTGYSAWGAYNQSKLANVLFTRELAYRERESGVTANALHPGFVASGFGRNNSGMGKLLNMTSALAINDEQGAQTSIYLASSPDVAGKSGLYFNKSRVAQPAAQALDDAAGQRLWALSENYL
ncbi:SDR family oxidoreductase [Deinococcus psychrotolerans]|uniref:SDR family oxidoreductase n=1 Tax=Deinococcus psychrotolerans TaxID=2489213 RepID=A0A3G8YJ37_9DEIO|nr:SDR family oxidoreductase [Deinococcus psychrotolerans]AZI42564.1 SDR family oxidoreductase [Deinococcus psychrotolerans]